MALTHLVIRDERGFESCYQAGIRDSVHGMILNNASFVFLIKHVLVLYVTLRKT